MSSPVLVVGARGLLGKALTRAATAQRRPWERADVAWSSPDAVAHAVGAVRRAHEQWGDDWGVAWCAGASVTGATPAQVDAEVATMTAFVAELVADGIAPPRFFFASSAGGVFAGASDPPFTELSEPRPLAPYGHGKLLLEEQVRALADAGTRVLVGRISNLYGPGQNLAKDQGLVTRLIRSSLVREPVGIYVSLDTIRDYLFVDDCARMILDGMDLLAARPPAAPVLKLFAAQQATTIAALLGFSRQVLGRTVLVTLGGSDLAKQQARDLRFRSVVWPELDRRALTTLPDGIHATSIDLRRSLAAGRL